MTTQELFEKIIEHYENAKDVIKPYDKNGNVFRARKHSVSSIEDLFAHYLSDHFKKKFPSLPLCFMVNYPIRPDKKGSKLFPDIAIIIDDDNPTMVSYLDVKTDLGYKREYYQNLPAIRSTVERLRQSKTTGTKNIKDLRVGISETITSRTVVISDTNMSKLKRDKNSQQSLLCPNVFKLYFLSGEGHPNSKEKKKIKFYDDEILLLLKDIELDILNEVNKRNKNVVINLNHQ